MLTRLKKCFDKLPVIFAKLTLHVINVDTSGKADGWNRRFDKLLVIFAKLTLHVIDANTSGKADASPISGIASSISEIPSSAEVACDKCRQIWKRRLAVVSEQAYLLRKLAPL
ncbi:hypothetical protein ACFX11_024957 [Malus domestica]